MSLARIKSMIDQHPLARQQRIAAWCRVAMWQLRSRLSDEVIVDWVAGQRFVAHRGMTGFTGNIYAGLHEFVDMAFVLHALRPTDLFADVGANVGSYTVLSAGAVGTRTVSFEPDPITAAKLARNIAINGLEDRVTVHEAAVGAESGTAHFTVGQDTINKVADEGDEAVREVRLTTLDEVFQDQIPFMAKIDVEGFEESVVEGAAAMLASPALQVLALETISPMIDEKLSAAGLVKAWYAPFERTLSLDPLPDGAANQLYVRDVELLKERLRTAPKFNVHGREI